MELVTRRLPASADFPPSVLLRALIGASPRRALRLVSEKTGVGFELFPAGSGALAFASSLAADLAGSSLPVEATSCSEGCRDGIHCSGVVAVLATCSVAGTTW